MLGELHLLTIISWILFPSQLLYRYKQQYPWWRSNCGYDLSTWIASLIYLRTCDFNLLLNAQLTQRAMNDRSAYCSP